MVDCDRCKVFEAEIGIFEGYKICSGCECLYNNILNDIKETKTLKEFLKECEA